MNTKNRDPVCGRRINRNKAHIVVEFKGEEYFLCCPRCQADFEREPERYMGRSARKRANR